ncbi:zinc finger protein 74 [Drosophila guanche]|uniref:Blast:Zinc finger protein 782 n=1 Tax=Drosophila guanche TaxID=7266 RepID=A0A3B0KSG0_DROGU|nr:zinc finger protein 74 [Drosophila guanche]SPP88806.1 blast:Zinc finger protein 782 [Drosophila guanche]
MSRKLTRETAQQHCLTCLLKLDSGQEPDESAISQEMQQLLHQHLDWPLEEELQGEKWLPQQLCPPCRQELQRFEQFRQRAIECRLELLDLLKEEECTEPSFEVVYEEPATGCQDEESLHSLEPPEPDPDPDPIDKSDAERLPEGGQGQTENENKVEKRNSRGVRNSLKCSLCQHSFAHKLTLSAHIRKVHEGSKRPFQCDQCDKCYSFMGGLYTHIKEIHATRERRYPCDQNGCDRVYTSSIAMQKHKRLKHSQKEPARKFICEQCGATFNQSANLNYHRRTKHPTEDEVAARDSGSEQHFCELCRKHFHSRYTLRYHTMQQHGDQERLLPHECQVCGRRMAKKFMLLQHMLTHSTAKMPCEHCGKLFARKFELEAHIRAVHLKLKPFACKYCSECFASRKTLRHHEYIHTGEKPYLCDVCGQGFRQQSCRKKHRMVHDKQDAGVSV